MGLFSKTEIKNNCLSHKTKIRDTIFFLIESVVIHLHSTHLSYLLHFISTERECNIEHTHTHTHTGSAIQKSPLWVPRRQ